MLNKVYFDIGLAHHATRGQFESALEQIKEWPLHVGYSIEGKRGVHPPLVLTNLLPAFGTKINYAEFLTLAHPQSDLWAENLPKNIPTITVAQHIELLGIDLQRPFDQAYQFRYREGRGSAMDGLRVDFLQKFNRVSSRHNRAEVYALPQEYSFDKVDPYKYSGVRHRRGMDEFRFVSLRSPEVPAEVS